jgi:cytochrome c2
VDEAPPPPPPQALNNSIKPKAATRRRMVGVPWRARERKIAATFVSCKTLLHSARGLSETLGPNLDGITGRKTGNCSQTTSYLRSVAIV